MVTAIENTVNINSRCNVYYSLATLKDYVWMESVFHSVCNELVCRPQRGMRNDMGLIKKYCDLIIRESHEKYLFHIWKRFPNKLTKIMACAKLCNHSMYIRCISRKLGRFKELEKNAETDIAKQPGTSPPSFIKKRNISAVHNNTLSIGDNKELNNTRNTSVESEQNWVNSSFNQRYSSPNSVGFQEQHLVRDSVIGNRSLNDLSISEHSEFNFTENSGQAISTVYNHNRDRNRADNRQNKSKTQYKEMKPPVGSQNKTVVNNVYERRETVDSVAFQNRYNKSCTNLSDVISNKKITSADCSANNNSNNGDDENEQSGNKKFCYPRPSAYKQRLNQFNENRATSATRVNRPYVLHPVEIDKPGSSKLYTNFDDNDDYVSGRNMNQCKEDLVGFKSSNIKRSKSTSDLCFNVSNRLDMQSNSTTRIGTDQKDIESVSVKKENDVSHWLDNCVSNNNVNSYYPQKCPPNALYSRDMHLSNTTNIDNRTNNVQQRCHQELFSSVSKEKDENRWNSPDYFTKRVENSSLMQQQHQDGESVRRNIEEMDEINIETNTELNKPTTSRASITKMMERPATPSLSYGHQNERDGRIMRFSKEQVLNARQQDDKFRNKGVAMLDCKSVATKQQISSTKLSMYDFQKDQNSVGLFLSVNDFHHVLNILEKWQNTNYINSLSNHLFVLLGEVNGNTRLPKRYNTYFGLMSTAISKSKCKF